MNLSNYNLITPYLNNSEDTINVIQLLLIEEMRNSKLEDLVLYICAQPERYIQLCFGENKSRDDAYVPMLIETGRGVVGTSIQRKAATLVPDTRACHVYIIDDKQRLSELCVPIMHKNEVIGALDSEHSLVNFYNEHHINRFKRLSKILAPMLATCKYELIISGWKHIIATDNSHASGLTPRETEVLQLFAKGYNRKDIADMLTLSVFTISGYIKEVYRKLQVNSKSEAVLEAVRMGLVEY